MARFYFVSVVSEHGPVHFALAVQSRDNLPGAIAYEFECRGLSLACEFRETGCVTGTQGEFYARMISADEYASISGGGIVCSECGAEIHGPRSWVRSEGDESRAYHPGCADALERAQRIDDYFAGYDTLGVGTDDSRFTDSLGDWSTD